MLQIIVNSAPSEPIIQTTSSFSWGIVLVVFLVLIGVIVGLSKLIRLLKRPSLQGLSRDQVIAMWQQIENTSEQGVMGGKLAVMEADKLLDHVLKSMSFPGETMAERLKLAEYKYQALRHVWPAHKLRNQLVHDPSFDMSSRQAKFAIKEFKEALKVLNVL